jgi:formylmethanofuran dehydrogenase subunit E
MNNHLTSERAKPKLKSLLEKAAEFHSHLGPFLVIGVRMGLTGLKEIGEQSFDQLAITASLPLHVPFSCIIDGLQVSTHCTVGNRRLSLEDSDTIQARFRKKENCPEVTIALNQSTLEKVKTQLLKEAMPDAEVRRLAWTVANMSEDDLFEITRSSAKENSEAPFS